jgi:hypothetical protein
MLTPEQTERLNQLKAKMLDRTATNAEADEYFKLKDLENKNV